MSARLWSNLRKKCPSQRKPKNRAKGKCWKNLSTTLSNWVLTQKTHHDYSKVKTTGSAWQVAGEFYAVKEGASFRLNWAVTPYLNIAELFTIGATILVRVIIASIWLTQKPRWNSIWPSSTQSTELTVPITFHARNQTVKQLSALEAIWCTMKKSTITKSTSASSARTEIPTNHSLSSIGECTLIPEITNAKFAKLLLRHKIR